MAEPFGRTQEARGHVPPFLLGSDGGQLDEAGRGQPSITRTVEDVEGLLEQLAGTDGVSLPTRDTAEVSDRLRAGVFVADPLANLTAFLVPITGLAQLVLHLGHPP
ncbi:MAG TPA: hypothetical protein VNT52_10200, partial [Acidimicrobiales bacterium]|nr:hypothetical protein [Acidimicrobiales bacterium]